VRRIVVVLAVLALAAVLLSLRATHHAPPPVPAETSARSAPPPEPTRITHAEVGFRSHALLAEHFRKHGRELNARDEAAYLAMAQTLRDRPAGGMVLEAVRGDGVTTRFDRATGAFLACNADLTIRTFFRPNEGEVYFRRQLEREH
jgi:pyocin large subunit-like protein